MLTIEKLKDYGADIDDDMENNLKTALMGPMAGIGDSVTQSLVKVVLLSIAIGLASQGSALGPILLIVLFSIYALGVGYFCYNAGYRFGKNAVTKLVPWDASDCAVKLVVCADADLAEVERTIRSKAHKALRDVLVPGHTVEVYFTELTSMGIRCTVHLHVKGGIGLDAQRDKLVRALAGSSWLASATLALEEE